LREVGLDGPGRVALDGGGQGPRAEAVVVAEVGGRVGHAAWRLVRRVYVEGWRRRRGGLGREREGSGLGHEGGGGGRGWSGGLGSCGRWRGGCRNGRGRGGRRLGRRGGERSGGPRRRRPLAQGPAPH